MQQVKLQFAMRTAENVNVVKMMMRSTVSIKEQTEQGFINKSVKVDIKNRIIHDPLHRLTLDKSKVIGI